MGESIYNNFIQQYETVRKVLKDMYVFGCYKNTIYEKKLGIKLKTYEKEIQRLQFYIDEANRTESRNSHWKVHGFFYDRFDTNTNYLFNSYKLKSYSISYLQLYLAIMQILNTSSNVLDDNPAAYTIAELAKELSKHQVVADEKEVGRKLEDLIEAGVVRKLKGGKKYKYALEANILDRLATDQLIQLYYAMDLYCNKAVCSTAGYYLKDTLIYYLKHYRKTELLKRNIYVFEHNFLQRILNDALIYTFVEAIQAKRKLSIRKYNAIFDNKTGESSTVLSPIAIIAEYRYGRQYVFGIEDSSKKAIFIRIDRIKEVKLLNKTFLQESFTTELERMRYSWCAALSMENEEKILVKIDFTYDTTTKYIRSILESEKQWGEIEDIDDNHCVFSIEVNDPLELKPWIRKFGKHARVRESMQHDLHTQLMEDWRLALKKYGAFSKE